MEKNTDDLLINPFRNTKKRSFYIKFIHVIEKIRIFIEMNHKIFWSINNYQIYLYTASLNIYSFFFFFLILILRRSKWLFSSINISNYLLKLCSAKLNLFFFFLNLVRFQLHLHRCTRPSSCPTSPHKIIPVFSLPHNLVKRFASTYRCNGGATRSSHVLPVASYNKILRISVAIR